MFAEKILRLISALFIGAYVARYLGPSKYGLLNYTISLVSLFSVFASMGLDSIVVRNLIQNETKRDVFLGTAFFLKMMGAFLVLVSLIIFVRVSNSDHETEILIYIIATGTFCEIFGVIDFFFQSKVMAKFIVWSQMIALFFISIFRLVLVWQKASLNWFAWTTTLDLFILGLGLIYFYQRSSHSIFKWKFDSQIAMDLLKDSWPLIFASLAVTVYMKIDQVMIKWMIGNEANGNYGVAVRITEMWNFIPVAISSSLFPAILNAREKSNELYTQRMQWLFDIMVLVSISIAIPMTFLSNWVVTILFGQEYGEAGNVLSIYIWASVFTFLGVANSKWIIGENLQIFRMLSLVISCVLNIVLNLILINTMGMVGAAIATLVAYSFAGYFSFLFFKSTRGIFFSMTQSFNPIRLFSLVRDFKKHLH